MMEKSKLDKEITSAQRYTKIRKMGNDFLKSLAGFECTELVEAIAFQCNHPRTAWVEDMSATMKPIIKKA